MLGAMEIFIWDSFLTEWKMDKECGRRVIAKIQINMKVDTKMIRNMDMENFNGVLEVNIKVIMFKI